MVWKIYHIQTGKVVRAGFETDDEAQEWLDERAQIESNHFEIEEMDEDEWIEYKEMVEKLELEEGEDSIPESLAPSLLSEDYSDDGDEESDDDFLTTIEEEDQ